MTTNSWKKFIRHLEKQCGEEPSFLAVMKYEKKEEVMNHILNHSELILDRDVIKKVSYNDLKITVYQTGKLILHGIKEKEEAINLLNEILEK